MHHLIFMAEKLLFLFEMGLVMQFANYNLIWGVLSFMEFEMMLINMEIFIV